VDKQQMTFACGCTGEDAVEPDEGLKAANQELLDFLGRAQSGMTGVQEAMLALGRSLAVTLAAFEELSRTVFGDEDSVVHACPPDGSGVMPCCQRAVADVAGTDRITEDPSAVTCEMGFFRPSEDSDATA
jgi:hypothetical protein